MTDMVKTLTYLGVAALTALVAVLSYPKPVDFQPSDQVGQPLFPEFTDPATAGRLQITKFDGQLGQLEEFEVAKQRNTGLWLIPSSDDYPADAEMQMRDAATALIDVQVLGIASETNADQSTFGVVQPARDMDVTQEGVGLMVGVKDVTGKDLAQLIIGKQVRGTEDQYFVRKPGQAAIYVVRIDPARFSTEFQDWIEEDLLQLNALDVERISLRDYTVATGKTLQGVTVVTSFDQRFEADVRFDEQTSKWELEQLLTFENNQPIPTKLLDVEELNSDKLNDMKNALDDLAIVGVLRKPKGLGANLKAETEFLNEREAAASLIDKGFFPLQMDGEVELRSANGEVYVTTRDGVQYVLRFGEIAGVEQEGDEGKLNRYLFVSARVDPTQFAELENTPPAVDGPDTGSPDTADESQPPADGAGNCGQDPAQPPADQPSGQQPGEPSTQESNTEDQPPAQQDPATEDSQPATPPAAPETTPPTADPAADQAAQEAQRQRDELQDKLEAARQRVSELNLRFGDWYYIISEDEYRKIHLGREDLIRAGEAASQEGTGVDAFRNLQDSGLKK